VRADTRESDEALRHLVQRIERSPRLQAAVEAIAARIDMLDILEHAGYPITKATITLIVDGGQVTSALEPAEGIQIRGGGAIRPTRGAS
jgi:hypothetical protein